MKLMIFSTMPTAAASVIPRSLAMTVITRKATWMNPSWRAMGTPIRSSFRITSQRGLSCSLASVIPSRYRRIIKSEMATLMAWDRVVPRAAPAGPIWKTPIKRQSSKILAAQAMAMNTMGLREFPRPRKMALMML